MEKESFNLKEPIFDYDSFFLYNKSSNIVPKFVTKLNKNVDLHRKIFHFGKKSKYRRWYKFNKTKSKNSIQALTSHTRKSLFQLTKLNGSGTGKKIHQTKKESQDENY